MSAGTDYGQIIPGLAVISRDGVELGVIERFDGAMIHIPGWDIPVAAVERVEPGQVHLRLARADFQPQVEPTAAQRATGQSGDETGERLVIPLAEERLKVGTREVTIGEVVIRKRIVEEERMVPVTLRREEVDVVRLAPGDSLPAGWEEGDGIQITRFPLQGTEPAIEKTAVVNREVVVERERRAEERQITDTVRREHVDVEERYRQARPQFERDFTEQWVAGDTSAPTFAQAEPQYRAGFLAGSDPRYAGQDFATIEPDLQQQYGSQATGGGDNWETLRRRIRAGFEAARQ